MTKHLLVLPLLLGGSFASAQATQAWGVNGGNNSFISLSMLDLSTGDVTGVPRRTDTLSNGAATRDLASDPLRYPAFVWGIRDGSAGNELIGVNPFEEGRVSYALLDTPDPIVAIAIDPTTGVMYGAAGTDLYSIDPFDGESAFIGSAELAIDDGLGFDLSGDLYAIDSDQIIAVDKQDGSSTVIGPIVTNGFIDLAADPSTGTLYALGPDIYDLVTIDSNGVVTTVGSSLGRPSGLAFTAVPEPGAAALGFLAMLGGGLGRARCYHKNC